MTLVNTSKHPVILSENKVLSLKTTPTSITDIRKLSHIQPQLNKITTTANKLTDSETIGLIKYGNIDPKVKHILQTAHLKYRKVFDKDLSEGYNSYFGQHICKLNYHHFKDRKLRKYQ